MRSEIKVRYHIHFRDPLHRVTIKRITPRLFRFARISEQEVDRGFFSSLEARQFAKTELGAQDHEITEE